MKTALARRNEWMRQLKRLRDERNRCVKDEPKGKVSNKTKAHSACAFSSSSGSPTDTTLSRILARGR
jgi:hypothetical protein